ncbi:vomeronasal type-1 receptor 4-like [Ctenodactylus gundi]
MVSGEAIMGMIFLSQAVFGVLGNISLLLHYLFPYFTGHRLKSTDVILQHLLLANSLALLSRGVPQTMAAFGLTDFLGDLGCKLVFYLHRVGRGVSMGSTCLLSVFQAITISPQRSRWAELKEKAPKYIDSCVLLCWVLHLLINITIPIYVKRKMKNVNMTIQKDLVFCSSHGADPITLPLHAALLVFPDLVCLSCMLWSSLSIVFILYRHKRQVQHIRRTHVSPRSSPESRVTRRVLFLVNTFVSFYTLSSILQVCFTNTTKPSWLLVNTAALVSMCFPAACPFVLMNDNFRLCRLCVGVRNMNSLLCSRND